MEKPFEIGSKIYCIAQPNFNPTLSSGIYKFKVLNYGLVDGIHGIQIMLKNEYYPYTKCYCPVDEIKAIAFQTFEEARGTLVKLRCDNRFV